MVSLDGLLLFAGFAFLLATVVVGMGGLQYTFYYAGASTANASAVYGDDDVRGVYEYERLTPLERSTVDRALDGERFYFPTQNESLYHTPGLNPGMPLSGADAKLAVQKGETYHVFVKRLWFNPGSPFALGSGGFALATVASFAGALYFESA